MGSKNCARHIFCIHGEGIGAISFPQPAVLYTSMYTSNSTAPFASSYTYMVHVYLLSKCTHHDYYHNEGSWVMVTAMTTTVEARCGSDWEDKCSGILLPGKFMCSVWTLQWWVLWGAQAEPPSSNQMIAYRNFQFCIFLAYFG